MGQMRVLVVRLGGLWCFSLCLSDPGLLPDRSAPVSLATLQNFLLVAEIRAGARSTALALRIWAKIEADGPIRFRAALLRLRAALLRLI